MRKVNSRYRNYDKEKHMLSMYSMGGILGNPTRKVVWGWFGKTFEDCEHSLCFNLQWRALKAFLHEQICVSYS